MELEIENREENPLLEREEFHLSVEHLGEATPSQAKLRKKFAAENDLDPEKLLVETVKTGFGAGNSKAVIRAYEEKVVDQQSEEPEEPEEAEEKEESAEEAEESEEAEKEETEEAEDSEEEASEEPEETEAEDAEEEQSEEDEEDKEE